MELNNFRARALGLNPAELFARAERAFRRVAEVAGPLVMLDGGSKKLPIPRVQLPRCSVGQWLQFTKTLDGIRIELNHEKTKEAEEKLKGLFTSVGAS